MSQVEKANIPTIFGYFLLPKSNVNIRLKFYVLDDHYTSFYKKLG